MWHCAPPPSCAPSGQSRFVTFQGASEVKLVRIVAGPGKASVSVALAVTPPGLMGAAPNASGSDEPTNWPHAPEPLNAIDCVPPGALSATVSVPALGTSPDEGVKLTVIVHVPLIAIVVGARGQLSVVAKSPPAPIELTASGAVPVFVRVTFWLVVDSTGSVGNCTDEAESVAALSGTTNAHVSPSVWLSPTSVLPPNRTRLLSALS